MVRFRTMTGAGNRRARLRRALGSARSHPVVIVVAGALLLSLPFVLGADLLVAQAVHQHVTGDWTRFLRKITGLGDATGYVIVTLLVLVVLHGAARLATARRGLLLEYARYGYLLLLGLAVSGLTVNVLKPLVGRLRPKYLLSEGWYGAQPLNFEFSMNSFPSGHSQTVWAVATVVLLVVRRLSREALAQSYPVRVSLFLSGAIAVAGAVTVSASRVLLNAHFVSDVIAGAALGAVATLALARKVLPAAAAGASQQGSVRPPSTAAQIEYPRASPGAVP